MASPIAKLPLEELYSRKMTPSVAKRVMVLEDFTKYAPKWCEKACTLNVKNPSSITTLVPTDPVDILVIQDYRAFDDIQFRKRGEAIEGKLRDILTVIFNSAGIGDLTWSLTTLLRCGIDQSDLKKGKPPTDTTLIKCSPYLLAEIRARKPKVIVSLSIAATKSLRKDLSNSNSKHLSWISEWEGTPLVLTLHPRILTMIRQNSSGKLWGPDFLSVILTDIRKAVAIARGELGIPDLQKALEKARGQITIARNIEQVEKMAARILELEPLVAYDIETTGLDAFSSEAKILCVQFGFKNPDTGGVETYVFPLWHRDNTWYDADEAWPFLAEILTNPNISKIGHNIKFDIVYTSACTGIRVQSVAFDTMLLIHQVNSGVQGCYGLKKAVWDYIPESGLGGYEDLLPPLTKRGKIDAEEEVEE